MASVEGADGEGHGGGQSRIRWQDGGDIFIRGRNNPEELENWRQLRNPDYFKAVKMGSEIFRHLRGISLEVRGKGGETTILGQEAAKECSSRSSKLKIIIKL